RGGAAGAVVHKKRHLREWLVARDRRPLLPSGEGARPQASGVDAAPDPEAHPRARTGRTALPAGVPLRRWAGVGGGGGGVYRGLPVLGAGGGLEGQAMIARAGGVPPVS